MTDGGGRTARDAAISKPPRGRVRQGARGARNASPGRRTPVARRSATRLRRSAPTYRPASRGSANSTAGARNNKPKPTSRKLLVNSQSSGSAHAMSSRRRPLRDMPRQHTPTTARLPEPGLGLGRPWYIQTAAAHAARPDVPLARQLRPKIMVSNRALRITMIVLTVIGLAVASYLTYVHYAGIKPACPAGESCTKVQTSVWSKLAGVPVALIGLIGYIALLASLLAPEGESSRLATMAFT